MDQDIKDDHDSICKHDLIGVKKLLEIHKNKINRIQIDTRIDNEKYLREHPELEFIIQSLLVKLLEDRPQNVIQDAGRYLHETNFRELYEQYKAAEANKELNEEDDK